MVTLIPAVAMEKTQDPFGVMHFPTRKGPSSIAQIVIQGGIRITRKMAFELYGGFHKLGYPKLVGFRKFRKMDD